MRSAIDLVKELYYWEHIGTSDDIVKLPVHRPEYQHLVRLYVLAEIKPDEIPALVLVELIHEMRRPVLFQPTFWRLMWVALKRKLWGH